MRTPRVPRKYFKTSFFHIITQGINRDFIFENSKDIKYYISIMYKLKKEYKINIIAYCIMNNHTHMLLEVNDSNDLSKYMQRLNSKYAMYYNQKYDRVGYVFRNRYKSEVIRDENHLYNCIKYIYYNPVKAGICTKPDEYPYSNYKYISDDIEELYNFMDVDDDTYFSCEKVIDNFLKTRNITLVQLKQNKQALYELILILKNQYCISLRQISEKILLGRETVRKLYNSSIKKNV